MTEMGASETHHPRTALFRLVGQQIDMDGVRSFVVARLHRIGKLHHVRYCRRLEQGLVVEMVKQDVQPLLRVIHLRLESGWCFGFDALHVLVEVLVNRLGLVRNMAAVTRC